MKMREAINLIESHDYLYVTNCTDSCHGHGGEAIHEMKRRAKTIDFDDLVQMVGMKELGSVFPDPISLEDDWAVSYFTSIWRGVPCVYVVHSGIENKFTLNG